MNSAEFMAFFPAVALRAMFTSVNVTEEEKRLFVLLMEGAAMVRYDIWIWKSSEQDQSLFKPAEPTDAELDGALLTAIRANAGEAQAMGMELLDRPSAPLPPVVSELLSLDVSGCFPR